MNNLSARIGRFLSLYYTPSLRALGILRIGVACVVLADLYVRAGALTAHYTDDGLWPRSLARTLGHQPGYWSFHLLGGGAAFEAFLFALHAALALFLLLGLWSPAVSFLLWIFSISLCNRNVFILQAGDDLLRIVLLCGVFLPWQARFSLSRTPLPPTSPLAYPLYLLSIASVYAFSVLHKSGAEWWSEGSAVYYALSLEQLRMPVVGEFLYQFPALMRVLTWLVMAIEALIPLLMLWPSAAGKTRRVALYLVMVLQLGIWSTLYVGLFFVIAIVTSFGLGGPAGIQPDLPSRSNRLASYAIALIAVASLAVNITSLPSIRFELRPAVKAMINAVRLDQRWSMFSPVIMKRDGWFVYEGVDAKGNRWDLRRNNREADFSEPPSVVAMYASDRWRKLAENMQDERYTFLRESYCAYYLRTWNSLHPEHPMQLLDLYFMRRESLPAYKTTPLVKDLYCVCDER